MVDELVDTPPTSPLRKPPTPRSVFARLTDILIISMLLILALTVGRQVLEWWHDDPALIVTPSVSTPAWGDRGQPVELQFGDAPGAMTRQVVNGDRALAEKKLVQRCVEITPSAQLPTRPVDAGEADLLKKLADRKPAAELADRWRVYHVEGPFALVVGLRSTRGTSKETEQPVAAEENSWRLVCWGSILPLAEKEWTLHLYTASGTVASETKVKIPLPSSARRIMSLGEAEHQVTGFTASDEVSCMRFYDRWFAEQGWTNSGWQAGGKAGAPRTWTARYRLNAQSGGDSQTEQSKAVGGIVYIQLTRDAGRVTGLISQSASPPPATESTRD